MAQSMDGTILIIDDQPTNCKVLSAILRKNGYAVLTAPYGRAGLEQARTHHPDLTLLDIKLPDINGYQVCRQLKAEPATCDIPVIFLSILDNAQDKMKAFESGGVDYVTWPFQAEEILARVRTHLQLQESQRQLYTLLDNLPGMAYRCRNDRNWTMLFLSSGCLGLTGYGMEQLLHNAQIAYADLIHPEDREMVWETVQAGLEQGRRFQCEYRIRTADGAQKWVWEQGVGVQRGGEMLVEGFITDLTARRVAEESLRADYCETKQTLRNWQSTQALRIRQERLAAIGQLAGGTAHSFNNLLAGIMGIAELVQQDSRLPEDLRQDMAKILISGQRGARMVKQLLDFAHLEQRWLGSLDLKKVVQTLANGLAPKLSDTIHLVIDLPSQGVILRADRDQLEQMLLNLIENAIQAMPTGGALTIKLSSSQNGKATLSVADTGNGMDEETLARLYEPFFTTHGPEHVGLGLAQVYGIVEQYDGHIQIESQRGQGTTVIISLPATAAGAEEQDADTQERP